jgi:hypothetical protein
VLDVMTAALLSCDGFDAPPAGGKILDFASGSGCIAAALRIASPALQLHLLDGDALAMDAAEKNVGGAAGYHLRSSWPASAAVSGASEADGCLGEGSHAFDWIVSNPPVHAGQPDDFRVVAELVAGAASRLKPGGVLWIVTQEQIPVGRIFAAAARAGGSSAGGYAKVEVLQPTGDRFVVWKATVRGGAVGSTSAAAAAVSGAVADLTVAVPEADVRMVVEAVEGDEEQPSKKKAKKEKKKKKKKKSKKEKTNTEAGDAEDQTQPTQPPSGAEEATTPSADAPAAAPAAAPAPPAPDVAAELAALRAMIAQQNQTIAALTATIVPAPGAGAALNASVAATPDTPTVVDKAAPTAPMAVDEESAPTKEAPSPQLTPQQKKTEANRQKKKSKKEKKKAAAATNPNTVQSASKGTKSLSAGKATSQEKTKPSRLSFFLNRYGVNE